MTAPEDAVDAASDSNQTPKLHDDGEKDVAFRQKAPHSSSHRLLRKCITRAMGWVTNIKRCEDSARYARWRLFILLLFCIIIVGFLRTAEGWKKAMLSENFNSTKEWTLPPSQIGEVPIQTVRLRKPPRIKDPFQSVGLRDEASLVPDDIARPYVFSAVGIPERREVNTSQSSVLLFLYSQGTLAWTGPGDESYSLNVTGCLIGRDRFPVLFHANGVYTCSISKQLSVGEMLSLVVSPTIWEKEPNVETVKTLRTYLSSSSRLEDGSLRLDSSVTWDGELESRIKPDDGRYKVCLMTQEKLFPEYIPEWIAYHRRIGIDYVYIYDNSPTKKISSMFENETDVEVVYWPWQRSQIQAQNHFLLVGRRRCEWAVMIDVDEYVMIRPLQLDNRTQLETDEKPLKWYLRRQREQHDYSQIRLMSVALGSSGHIYRPREPVAEAYWHTSNIQDNLTKPIAWLGHTIPDTSVHHVHMAPTYYTHKTRSMLETSNPDEIGLCHMKYRSWEDYVRKGRGGRNSFHVQEWTFSESWSVHSPNKNHVRKRNADTFVEFRNLWRRLMTTDVQPPELEAMKAIEDRYKRVVRPGFAWKRRRGFNRSIFVRTIVEEEKWFRALKRWEIAKRERLQKMGRDIEL